MVDFLTRIEFSGPIGSFHEEWVLSEWNGALLIDGVRIPPIDTATPLATPDP